LEGEEDKVNLSDFQFPEGEGEGAPHFFFIPSNLDCNLPSTFPPSFFPNYTHLSAWGNSIHPTHSLIKLSTAKSSSVWLKFRCPTGSRSPLRTQCPKPPHTSLFVSCIVSAMRSISLFGGRLECLTMAHLTSSRPTVVLSQSSLSQHTKNSSQSR